MTDPLYAVLYDAGGVIRQRMSGGETTILATAEALNLTALPVPDDGAYEQTHKVVDGALVPDATP